MTHEARDIYIYRGGARIAEAINGDIAAEIAEALNSAGVYETDATPDLFHRQNSLHAVRQESDEYACLCGRRWDVRDGEECPGALP